MADPLDDLPDEDGDTPEGEFVEIPEDGDVEDTEDGGAIVHLDEEPKAGDSKFYANLAETAPRGTLNSLATELLQLLDRDKEARSDREKKYAEGLKRTGLGDDAPGGADFEGASKVVHPVLTEVAVDFSARAIKELWPANGPAKSKIVGDVTKDKVLKANRKAEFLNWQLTVQAKEARAEVEQLLTQVPLGGVQYLKLGWDARRNRPTFLYVPIDDMYLPYAATNFYTAQRKTHVQYLTELDYKERVRAGDYVDVDLTSPSMTPETSRAAQANDKIEGKTSDPYNSDGVRKVFEIYVTTTVEGDPLPDGDAPYVITVDDTSRTVLSIYRNWDEEDDSCEELQWFVEFPFVPWRGVYAIGMIHMIGGLAGAATGALRALLDSAHIANSQSMVKLKGGTRGGQSLTIQPTEVLEIEGGINVDDIRKLAMPLPFNQPSQTLFELLGFVVDAAKGVVRTTLDDMATSTENTPVGTTLARIEQGMTVFSAIHGRLHNAMQRMLDILSRLNAMYLDDEMLKKLVGELLATRADFDGPQDVVPVSDPNIFSEAQRYAQIQAVAQRSQLNPLLYDQRKVEERILETLKIPNAKDLLKPAMTPTEENAISENVKAALGRPIVAFPDQDHIAHLKAHMAFMTNPALGQNPLLAPTFLVSILPHIKEHIVLWYAAEVFATANDVTDEDLSDLIGHTKDKEAKKGLDRLAAEASLDVVAAAGEVFGPQFQQVLDQAMQMASQMAPKPPMDPAVQVAMADVEARKENNQIKAQGETAKRADETAARADEARREEIREDHEDARAVLATAGMLEAKGVDAQQSRQDAALDLIGGMHAAETDAHAQVAVATTQAQAAPEPAASTPAPTT